MYSIPVVYQYTSIHCDISYTIIGSLYEVVYCIRNVHYTSIRLYEYPLIRVSAAPPFVQLLIGFRVKPHGAGVGGDSWGTISLVKMKTFLYDPLFSFFEVLL